MSDTLPGPEAPPAPPPQPPSPAAASMTAADLAELLAAFNEVTAKLHATHDQLRAQVARLSSELSEANRQLERSRRLAALGEMAAGIAHEVRNPLGSIRLYAGLLRQDLADRPAAAAIAEKIAHAARGLNDVVGDVLSFSRELKLRATPTDPAEVLCAARAACQHDGVPGWRTVEFRTGPGFHAPLPSFAADASLLQQALTNLIRNAIEAVAEHAVSRPSSSSDHPAPPLGIVTLDLLPRTSDAGIPGLSFLIADTGPGVSPEVLERMFNPFFTTREAGTGLGLAIVHRIIDAHSGHITVTSAIPHGARFDVWLPLTPRPADQSHYVPVVTLTPAARSPAVSP